MSKIVIYPALLSIFLATGCAYPAKQPPPASAKTSAERITIHGLSRNIITEAKQIATAHCEEQDKQFTFMRNIFRKKTWLGLDWLTCDLYFACTAEGEPPPSLPAHHIEPVEPDELISDTAAQPATPQVDAPPEAKQPKQATAVPPKKKSVFDQDCEGELESLGPEPLGPGDAQPSAAQDQGIIEEIL